MPCIISNISWVFIVPLDQIEDTCLSCPMVFSDLGSLAIYIGMKSRGVIMNVTGKVCLLVTTKATVRWSFCLLERKCAC